MKYYVNQLTSETTWNKRVIGLFTECRCDGDADCQAEYYYDTILLAKYEICEDNILSKGYDPEIPYINYTECNVPLDKVLIGSGYWTKLIETESDEQARELFQRQEWSDYVTPHCSAEEYKRSKG